MHQHPQFNAFNYMFQLPPSLDGWLRMGKSLGFSHIYAYFAAKANIHSLFYYPPSEDGGN
jgi:hypothetical protein